MTTASDDARDERGLTPMPLPEFTEMIRDEDFPKGLSFGRLVQHDAALRARLAAAEARLPEGMKHCTIRFEQCAEGHGWLTATNWVVQVCPTCRIAAAEARCAELERERDALSISCSNAVSARDAADARRAEVERERDEWKSNAGMQSVMAGDRAGERNEAIARADRYKAALREIAERAPEPERRLARAALAGGGE